MRMPASQQAVKGLTTMLTPPEDDKGNKMVK